MNRLVLVHDSLLRPPSDRPSDFNQPSGALAAADDHVPGASPLPPPAPVQLTSSCSAAPNQALRTEEAVDFAVAPIPAVHLAGLGAAALHLGPPHTLEVEGTDRLVPARRLDFFGVEGVEATAGGFVACHVGAAAVAFPSVASALPTAIAARARAVGFALAARGARADALAAFADFTLGAAPPAGPARGRRAEVDLAAVPCEPVTVGEANLTGFDTTRAPRAEGPAHSGKNTGAVAPAAVSNIVIDRHLTAGRWDTVAVGEALVAPGEEAPAAAAIGGALGWCHTGEAAAAAVVRVRVRVHTSRAAPKQVGAALVDASALLAQPPCGWTSEPTRTAVVAVAGQIEVLVDSAVAVLIGPIAPLRRRDAGDARVALGTRELAGAGQGGSALEGASPWQPRCDPHQSRDPHDPPSAAHSARPCKNDAGCLAPRKLRGGPL